MSDDEVVVHYNDVIICPIASQITSLTIVYSILYTDADQRKHQSFSSLAFVRGIHRGPVNSPHKWPVTRKRFPFDDVIMSEYIPRNMHTGRALLWFGIGRYYPYPSGLLPWHWVNLVIAPVPMKQPWRIWVNRSHESVRKSLYNHNKTKHNKPMWIFLWDIRHVIVSQNMSNSSVIVI